MEKIEATGFIFSGFEDFSTIFCGVSTAIFAEFSDKTEFSETCVSDCV
jgi:hypothetical protein